MPALTTAFDEDLQVDHEFVARHARWQIENGVSGLVALGSLGGNAAHGRKARHH
jgi:4-hydroxy-tetrahydrodipicolinate synthase